MDLTRALQVIEAATSAAELFPVGDPKATYRRLAMVCHPDRYDGEDGLRERVEIAFKKLSEMYASVKPAASVEIDGIGWAIGRPLAKGGICDVYTASNDDCEEAVLKIARRGSDVALMRREAESLAALQAAGEDVVLEGSQGVLLDEDAGFAPYNTWTSSTFSSADRVLAEAGRPGCLHVGVIRTYGTRLGPGPFPAEDASIRVPEPHNGNHRWMGRFRQGHFDMVMARYACDVARPDALFLTHVDRRPSARVAVEYDVPLPAVATTDQLMGARASYRQVEHLTPLLEHALERRVRWESHGPTSAHVTGERRMAA